MNPSRKETTLNEHTYAEPADVAPRNILPETPVCTIEPKYADDITYASTSQPFINNIEETVPPKLQEYNLGVNDTETEKIHCPRSTKHH